MAYQLVRELNKQVKSNNYDNIPALMNEIESKLKEHILIINICMEVTSEKISKEKIEMTKFNLSVFFNDTWVKKHVETQNITIDLSACLDIVGNKLLVELILLNLIHNAEFSIKMKGSGDIYIYGDPKNNSLYIKDTGIGMDSKKRLLIGDMYSNFSYGLSFCKRAMIYMDGNIKGHKSKLNEYLIFKLTFKK